MISKELIQKLRKMEGKATKGPWGIVPSMAIRPYGVQVCVPSEMGDLTLTGGENLNEILEPDAHLIVELRNNAVALITSAEECERLREEVERLKQTSVEVEKPDGSKAYVQMHCTYPHDHIANPDIGFKML